MIFNIQKVFVQKRLFQKVKLRFKKYDKVRYFGNEYFIKGRRTSGYFTLMDIYGQTISFNHMSKGQKTPKAKNCHRISARKSWIVTTKKLENIA